MDKRFIKALLNEGKPFSEVPQRDALTKLNNDIMTVYVMHGVHRSMQPEAFKEEVRTCAAAIYQELTNDPAYRTIRDREVSYIFSNGMKGRLSTDKDIGLSYKNLIRWVEGYVRHPERKEAMRQFCEEHRPKPQMLPPREITEEEYEQMIRDAWADFLAYKKQQEERAEAIKSGKAKKLSGREPKSIAEVMGIPFSVRDYGQCRVGYLRRIGYAEEDETLSDIFEAAYTGQRKFDIEMFSPSE